MLLEGILEMILGNLASYIFLDSSCVHTSSGCFQEDVIEKPSIPPQKGIVQRDGCTELISVNIVVVGALLNFSSGSS